MISKANGGHARRRTGLRGEQETARIAWINARPELYERFTHQRPTRDEHAEIVALMRKDGLWAPRTYTWDIRLARLFRLALVEREGCRRCRFWSNSYDGRGTHCSHPANIEILSKGLPGTMSAGDTHRRPEPHELRADKFKCGATARWFEPLT